MGVLEEGEIEAAGHCHELVVSAGGSSLKSGRLRAHAHLHLLGEGPMAAAPSSLAGLGDPLPTLPD